MDNSSVVVVVVLVALTHPYVLEHRITRCLLDLKASSGPRSWSGGSLSSGATARRLHFCPQNSHWPACALRRGIWSWTRGQVACSHFLSLPLPLALLPVLLPLGCLCRLSGTLTTVSGSKNSSPERGLPVVNHSEWCRFRGKYTEHK